MRLEFSLFSKKRLGKGNWRQFFHFSKVEAENGKFHKKT
jgi:hypothetical protein